MTGNASEALSLNLNGGKTSDAVRKNTSDGNDVSFLLKVKTESKLGLAQYAA